jgi:putative copper export protein
MSQNVTPETTPPAEPLYRHPLNLPRGSVRTSLVLLILLPFWVLLLSPVRIGPMPLYLYFLLGLVLVFFAAHGAHATEDEEEEGFHWMSRALLFLSIVGTIVLIGFRLWNDPNDLQQRLTPNTESAPAAAPYLLIATLGGYGLGWLMSHLLGSWRNVFWWQDTQAAISLLGMFLLTGAFFWTVFIQPQLEQAPDTKVFESIVVAVAAWYFGARS